MMPAMLPTAAILLFACASSHPRTLVVTGTRDDWIPALGAVGIEPARQVDGTDPDELLDLLLDPDRLARFDLIAVAGGFVEAGIVDPAAGGDLADSEQALANLRAFVADGGDLLVSDQGYDLVERGWPDALDFVGDDLELDAAQAGEAATINAGVKDTSLANWLEADYLDLVFPQSSWAPILSADGTTGVHLSGAVRYDEGAGAAELPVSPLLASLRPVDEGGIVAYFAWPAGQDESEVSVEVVRYMLLRL